MPEMNGVETARKIRNSVGENAPIIILTAYDWTDIEEEARAVGVTAFCAKPLFMSDLKSALLAANNPSAQEESDAAPWTLENFSGKRVLLVDDVDMNREIAEIILEEAGFVVETAPDGTDAVAMVEPLDNRIVVALRNSRIAIDRMAQTVDKRRRDRRINGKIHIGNPKRH